MTPLSPLRTGAWRRALAAVAAVACVAFGVRLRVDAAAGHVSRTSLLARVARAQSSAMADPIAAGYDLILDTQVRDGLVYYRALKAARGPLDRFVASLASASLGGRTREAQIAFWLNAYNAIVLQTVIDHHPIQPLSDRFPASSVRQIPDFGRTRHRLAGRDVTLDEIEEQMLIPFGDPRVFFALGRGAVGSGRLRSEAYTEENLDRQLAAVAFECATRDECMRIDRASGRVAVSAIFSWRQPEFVARYADAAPAAFAGRSPIERAVLAFVGPALYRAEQDLLAQNRFRVEFLPFDWSLNER